MLLGSWLGEASDVHEVTQLRSSRAGAQTRVCVAGWLLVQGSVPCATRDPSCWLCRTDKSSVSQPVPVASGAAHGLVNRKRGDISQADVAKAHRRSWKVESARSLPGASQVWSPCSAPTHSTAELVLVTDGALGLTLGFFLLGK